jgi:fluoroquinolone resistance protein
MAELDLKIDDFIDQTLQDLDYIEGYLENKTFKNCIFKHCNFMQCTFESCSFVDCTFENCDLSVIKHNKTHFANLIFKKSKAIGVNWTEKFSFKITLEFYNSVINYSIFMGMTLRNFKLIDSIAHEVDFGDTKMKDAICTGTDFQDSVFLRTQLTNADFRKATNYTINPQNNAVKKANFSLPDALTLLSEFGVIVEGYEN